MPRDSSIDDFLPDEDPGEETGEDGTSDADSGREAEPAPPDSAADSGTVVTDTESANSSDLDGEVTDPDPRPARSTFDWSPDTVACDRCGDPVSRRWRDGDLLVCGDCKEW